MGSIKDYFNHCSVSKPRHTLSSSMRQIFLLLAFVGLSKASLFQARSGHWELCQYQKDTNGRYQLGSCVPGGSCDSDQQLEGENSCINHIEKWKGGENREIQGGTMQFRPEIS